MQHICFHLVMSFFCAVILAAPMGWSAEPTPATATVTAPAVAGLTVMEALEAMGDEDAATRQQALAALEACTEKEIPALEKAALHSDLEIRNRATLILKKVKRGEAAVIVTFVDGTPAAGLKFNGKLLFFPPAPLNQDKAIEDGKRRKSVGPHAEECASGEYTTDAGGKLSFGRFPDGAYRIVLTSPDGFPCQHFFAELKLTFGAAPVAWSLQRGVTATVRVLDEAGQPVEGVTVASLASAPPAATLKQHYNEGQALAIMAKCNPVTSDAKGTAVLEGILGNGQSLGACKPGWQLTIANLPKCDDGGTVALDLTLHKLVPVEVKLTCIAIDRMSLAPFRVLLVPIAKVDTCLGNDWKTSLEKSKIDAYLATGALDAGTPNDKGDLTLQLLPGEWMLVGFSKDSGTMLHGSVSFGSHFRQASVQMYTLAGGSSKELCLPRGKILCPPAEAVAGAAGNAR